MKKLFFPAVLILILISFTVNAQVTGLSGWNIYLDPGHSQTENQGAFDYSEAHKVLRVGLNLQQMLLNETDIDTVYISRTNDTQIVDLSQRTDHANALAAAWYHSIHSDAGGPTANSTLLLWGQNGNGTEKIPNGGKAMSSHIVELLTRGYRTTTRGSYGDCSFYGTCSSTSGPYLSVNRRSTMPSELSEAGFHTNPTQNMINMNNDWKRLEARTFFWSILKHHNIARPAVNIVAGHIRNIEEGYFVNGAVVSFDGQTDTTDTFESLFNKYSTDPNQLRNGFFYFENVNPGTHTLTVSLPGYYSYTTDVTVSDTFFTYVDPMIISNVSPTVVSTFPIENDSIYPGSENVSVFFSRPMDRASVEANLVVTPAVETTFNWSEGDKKVTISSAGFDFSTDYIVKISGLSKDKYDHQFDGNTDGVGGDDYSFQFRTKMQDAVAPQYLMVIPDDGYENSSLQPIISITFDEPVKASSLSNKLTLLKTADQTAVTLPQKYYIVNGKGVLTGFVRTALEPNTNYTISVAPGIQDVFGNINTEGLQYTFTTGDVNTGTVINFDNFESGIAQWWQPSQSGSTSGILGDETFISSAADIFNTLYAGQKSMKLNYGWDTGKSEWLLREYTPIIQSFNSNFTLKLYIFGDGQNNLFRFCVRDGSQTLEVSKWYTIDWYGWKEVSWTPSVDGFGTWIGDGAISGTTRIDSYQFSYVQGNNNIGAYYIDDAIIINNTSVDVEDENTIEPVEYVLDQNYPNPFNPSTKIRFGLKNSGNVKLEVFNLLGQKIKTLVNSYLENGYHTVNFDASDLPSGVYVYRIDTPEFTSSRKLILMK